MDSAAYWFVISPISAVITVAVAFIYADGIWRLLLLGIAAFEALPLVLLVGFFAIMILLSDDTEDTTESP